jgi:chemotaxis signal transduction protein
LVVDVIGSTSHKERILEATKQEFLTFEVGKEEFGVEVLRVQEIRSWEVSSPLPMCLAL